MNAFIKIEPEALYNYAMKILSYYIWKNLDRLKQEIIDRIKNKVNIFYNNPTPSKAALVSMKDRLRYTYFIKYSLNISLFLF